MKGTRIITDNTVFVILSFEGPDRYSLAGGLGVRVTNLSLALARSGYLTHLIFVGDPKRPGEESSDEDKLITHRWCQWISDYYPDGVYQGENEKLYDFNESLPPFIVHNIVKPAVAQGKLVVILGEEWHTAEAMCRISDLLYFNGLRDKVVMFWNANNTFSFDRINWGRLAYATTITTVSRYMKHVMWEMGLNPLVIPNGIPNWLLEDVDLDAVTQLRKLVNADLLLSKVARWDPDKRWNMAVEATARLKANGTKAVLVARGGMESHGEEVLSRARRLGLTIHDVTPAGDTFDDYVEALAGNGTADVVNLRSHCPQEVLRVIYRASDAVLANSGREPFGLVGLEAMAAGGIAFIGNTGEDYAVPFHNSVVLETAAPEEIEISLMYLEERPEIKTRIREAARRTARRFTWDEVLKNLIQKLEYQAVTQGTLDAPRPRKGAVPRMEPIESQDMVPAQQAVIQEPEPVLEGAA